MSGMAVAALVLAAATANAADIRIIAANAVKEMVVEVASGFEKATGNKVVLSSGGTEGIAKRVSSGEAFDLVLIAAPNIDKLVAEGRLAAGSRTDFARSGVGIAVRAGLPRPDVSSYDAVKNAVLAARSVAYSSGPSGFYLADLFKKMGISDQIKDKVRQPPSGVQVGDLLARGEADLGFQQISELNHVKGIEYLGPLPPDIQNITVYAIGLHASSPVADAARELVKALTSPEAGKIIRKAGMDPA
jgi:molybdate transport system substrate-binding protein